MGYAGIVWEIKVIVCYKIPDRETERDGGTYRKLAGNKLATVPLPSI